MKEFRQRIAQCSINCAVGLTCGIMAYVVSLETISIIFFGLGLYGPTTLTLGAIAGVVAGAILGPLSALLRLSRLQSVTTHLAIVTVLMLSIKFAMIYRGSYTSVESALASTAQAVLFALISSIGGAIGTDILLKKVAAYRSSLHLSTPRSSQRCHSDRPYEI